MAPDGAGHACHSAESPESRLERSAEGARRRGATVAGALARLCVLALTGWCTVASVGGQQVPVQSSPFMKPLLGGHLYWRVNRDFMKGGKERQVHFTLLTAFEANEDACIYSAGDRVMCGGDGTKESPPNGAADVHGVLCVKMIRHQDTDDKPQIITPNIRNADGTMGACPYVHELQTWRLTSEEQSLCLTDDLVKIWRDNMPPVRCYSNIHPAMTSVGGNAYRPANSSDAVLPVIGTENNFDVLSIHESDNVNEALRKINRRKIVFGAKQHTVIVPEDVSGIVAYLAAPNGTVILAGQGVCVCCFRRAQRRCSSSLIVYILSSSSCTHIKQGCCFRRAIGESSSSPRILSCVATPRPISDPAGECIAVATVTGGIF
jgi:hypothetical protein